MRCVNGRAFCVMAMLLFAVCVASGCSARKVTALSHAEVMAMEASAEGTEAYLRGDPRAALVHFRESLRMNRGIDNRVGETRDLINIGRTLTMLGDYRGAVAVIDEAEVLAISSGHEETLSDAYLTSAKAMYMAGDAREAVEDLDKAVSIRKKLGLGMGSALNLKGVILMKAGRPEDAAVILKKALSANKKRGDVLETANSYRALAELSEKGYYPGPAMMLYEAAYEIDKAAGDSRKIALDLGGMAGLRLKEKNLKEAAFLYERAYVVSVNGGLAGQALDALSRIISTYREMGEEEKAGRYMEIKNGISKGLDAEPE